MPKRLLIVESPGKVKKLGQILGGDWMVRASCGQMKEEGRRKREEGSMFGRSLYTSQTSSVLQGRGLYPYVVRKEDFF